MKKAGILLVLVMCAFVSGCEKKTESEKMMDAFKKDANHAMDEVKKEVNNL